MNEKLAIPQVIREAVHNALASYPVAANTGHAAEIACEAFARAMKEHPIVPTGADVMTILQDRVNSGHITGEEYCAIPPATVRFVVREWLRRMFDAPEAEVPEAIRDMLLDARAPDSEHCFFKPSVYNERIQEAYRRGRESK